MPHPRENYQIAVLRRFPSRRAHDRFPMKLGMLLLQDIIYILLDVLLCSIAEYFLRVVPYFGEPVGLVKKFLLHSAAEFLCERKSCIF